MKPLLSKTTKPFLLYLLIVLLLSIPIYYIIIDSVWKDELDEHNRTIANNTQLNFNKLHLSDEQAQSVIALWNNIQPNSDIENIATLDTFKDSLYIKNGANRYTQEYDRYRFLSTIIHINKKPYRFVVFANLEEANETIAIIGITTAFFFIVIVIGLLILTRRLNATVWQPFQTTLYKLKNFNLTNQIAVQFEKSNITEFEELNQSLTKLINQNIAAYKTQKEFTENASHELQTPIAIMKNKLDILLQNEDLTNAQYNIVEDMNKALMRSARINSNLLLLAKIENHLFDNSELICLNILLEQSLDVLQEHFAQKNITITTHITPNISITANKGLCEVLVNNLLLNAIRHTPLNGSITVSLIDDQIEVANLGTKALNHEMLFKRFYKQNDKNAGSGLGLSIVKEICKFHNWELQYKYQNNNHIFTINTNQKLSS